MAVFTSEVAGLTKALIETLTGIKKSSSGENYRLCFKYARSNFKYHKFLDVNELLVELAIKGLHDKFTVHSQPEKAVWLQELSHAFLTSDLQKHSPRSPAHYGVLQFLLCMAHSPVHSEYAPPTTDSPTPGPGSHFDWSSYLMEGIEYASQSGESEWSQLSSDEEDDTEDYSLEAEALSKDASLEDSAVELAGEEGLLSGEDTLREGLAFPYWTSRQSGPAHYSSSSSSLHPACNMAADWRAWCGATQSGSSSLLTEVQLLRETLWVLLGADRSVVFTHSPEGRVGVCAWVEQSHLTPLALRRQLEHFAAMATRLHRMRSFSRTPTGSVTCDAFAAGLSVWLEGVLGPVRAVEKALVAAGCRGNEEDEEEDTMTLLKLAVELQETDREVRDMHELFLKCTSTAIAPSYVKASTVLDSLWLAVQHYDSMASTGLYMLRVVLPLWLLSVKPYLAQLELWMTTGQLTPASEFCVQRSAAVPSSHSDYWQQCFVVRQPAPAFLSPVLDKVVLAGKSVHIIQTVGQLRKVAGLDGGWLDGVGGLQQAFQLALTSELQRLEMRSHDLSTGHVTTAEDHTPESAEAWDFDPLMRHYISSLHTPTTPSTEPSPELWGRSGSLLLESGCMQCPLSVVLQSSLHPLLQHKYLKACGALVELLRSDFALSDHFTAVQRSFLMADGEAVHHFTSDVFDRIRCGECWRDSSYLNTVLLEALQRGGGGDGSTELEGRLSVVCSAAVGGNPPSLDAITAINLQYKVPWPLETVFSRELMQTYLHIFHYLLQVRWAKWSLEQLHTRACLLRGVSQQTAVKLHLFHIFRARLLHFVNSLNNYLMTRILHSVGMEFTHNISQASDLEAIITLHSEYVATIFDRCLLNKKAAYVKEAILNILRLALRFRQQWDQGLETFSFSSAEKLEVEFTKCSHFLVSCLRSTVKRGTFPHLETLAFSLEFLGSQQKIFTAQNMAAL